MNLKEGNMSDLIGKNVVVETQDMTYVGKLVEVGEEEVYLESDIGWIVIPTDRIATIKEKES